MQRLHCFFGPSSGCMAAFLIINSFSAFTFLVLFSRLAERPQNLWTSSFSPEVPNSLEKQSLFQSISSLRSKLTRIMNFTHNNSPDYLAEYIGRQVIDVAIFMATLEIIFIGLFFVTRVRNKTTHGIDIYLMIPAFVFFFSLVLIILGKLFYSFLFFTTFLTLELLRSNLPLVRVNYARVGRH